MTETKPKEILTPNWEWDLLKPEYKDCVIGGYIQMKFLTKKRERAMCKLCEGNDMNATFLPMREMHRILNKKTFSVKKIVYHPSINNYCSKCGDELYDNGECIDSPCCNAPAVKHFTEKIKWVPNYMFKHQFSKLFSEFKNILIPEE